MLLLERIRVVWRKVACIQLKFHAICNHQVYYLYYALKITKIYVKINTSKIHQVMKSKTNEFNIIVMLLLKTFYFRLKFFSSNLTWCLHSPLNSFLLFNYVSFMSLKCSIRRDFSPKHSKQKVIFVLPCTFSIIDHVILDVIRSFFNNHLYFDKCALFRIVHG